MSSKITGVEPGEHGQFVQLAGGFTIGPRIIKSTVTALSLLIRHLPGGTPVRIQVGDRRLPLDGVALEQVPGEDGPIWTLVLTPAEPIRATPWEQVKRKREERDRD